jgi:hypothetical protein
MNRLNSLIGLLWFFVTAALALTASLVVLGGTGIIASDGVRLVVVSMLGAFAFHGWSQFRHRHEPITDERLLRAKERRGF